EISRPLVARFNTEGITERPSQSLPKSRFISPAPRREAPDMAFPIGLDERDVDPVHGRAAHQPQRAPHLAHGGLPVQFAPTLQSPCRPVAAQGPTESLIS